MKNKAREFEVYKKFMDSLMKLHWDTYRIGQEVNNKNTSLWKELRRKNN
jgi:hypothetical protein